MTDREICGTENRYSDAGIRKIILTGNKKRCNIKTIFNFKLITGGCTWQNGEGTKRNSRK